VPAPSTSEVEASLFLIGDAGEPKEDDRVLAALTREASTAVNASIVFLGDNLYDYGLPDTSAPDRAIHEQRLRWQMAAGLRSGVPTYFIPGNHDWENGRATGWAAIQRQEAFIAAEGRDVVTMVPSGGCPGPVVLEIAGGFRLIALDSQWWLQRDPKPTTECRPGTEEEVVDALAHALDVPTGTDAVVVLHHPLKSHGPHGGHFPVEDHIFPLHNLVSWLYLPLPIIGSLYPVARMNGISDQDFSGSRNEHMRQRLSEALASHAPRVIASGHEHTLQVLGDSTLPTLLVSGSGYDGHVERVAWGDDTRFAASIAGFMRLDRLADGRLRLAVLRPDSAGVVELHSEWLPAPPH
jgi:DNA repair exonuclease SbcCD nuclease subunit